MFIRQFKTTYVAQVIFLLDGAILELALKDCYVATNRYTDLSVVISIKLTRNEESYRAEQFVSCIGSCKDGRIYYIWKLKRIRSQCG